MARKRTQDIFTRFSSKTSEILGRPWVFSTAVVIILIWGISGPVLKFSETWQLVINTSTTIITFLMVFIIQNTQNRNDMAVNLKLDKLLEDRGYNSEEVLAAEDQSDKKLEREQKREQKKAKTQKSRKKSSRNT